MKTQQENHQESKELCSMPTFENISNKMQLVIREADTNHEKANKTLYDNCEADNVKTRKTGLEAENMEHLDFEATIFSSVKLRPIMHAT